MPGDGTRVASECLGGLLCLSGFTGLPFLASRDLTPALPKRADDLRVDARAVRPGLFLEPIPLIGGHPDCQWNYVTHGLDTKMVTCAK